MNASTITPDPDDARRERLRLAARRRLLPLPVSDRVLGRSGRGVLALGASIPALVLAPALDSDRFPLTGWQAGIVLFVGVAAAACSLGALRQLSRRHSEVLGGPTAVAAVLLRDVSAQAARATGLAGVLLRIVMAGLAVDAVCRTLADGSTGLRIGFGVALATAGTLASLLPLRRTGQLGLALVAAAIGCEAVALATRSTPGDLASARLGALTDSALVHPHGFEVVSAVASLLVLVAILSPSVVAGLDHVAEAQIYVGERPKPSGAIAAAVGSGVLLLTFVVAIRRPELLPLGQSGSIWGWSALLLLATWSVATATASASRILVTLGQAALMPRRFASMSAGVPVLGATVCGAGVLGTVLVGPRGWLLAGLSLVAAVTIAIPPLCRLLPRWPRPPHKLALALLNTPWILAVGLGLPPLGLADVAGASFALTLLVVASGVVAQRRARSVARPHALIAGLLMTAVLVAAVVGGSGSTPTHVAVLVDLLVLSLLLAGALAVFLPGMVAAEADRLLQESDDLAQRALPALMASVRALGESADASAQAPRPTGMPSPRVELSPAREPSRRRDELWAVADAQSEVTRAVASVTDAVADVAVRLQRAEADARARSGLDALTGLPNRQSFERELLSTRGSRQSVVVLDLDGFGDLNDSRGHAVGDDVLRRTAAMVVALSPADAWFGRLGADDFAILLPGGSGQDAAALAARLVNEVHHLTFTADGREVRTSASAGVAAGPGDGVGLELLNAAEASLATAQEHGSERIGLAWERTTGEVGRHDRAQSIREALENRRFELHAQPIRALATGEISHHELLIRMRDDQGLVPPGLFLDVAERTGMVVELDRWVVQQACTLIRAGLATEQHIMVAVNLSGQSMTDPATLAFVEREISALPSSGPKPKLEITETSSVGDLATAAQFCERMIALGCNMVLDDFGAAYASFHYLRNLPFQAMKIDGEFVRDMTRRREDLVLVRALTNVAHDLGMTVTAEYVEDEATLTMLAAIGVDHAQGNHIGLPVPVREAFGPAAGSLGRL